MASSEPKAIRGPRDKHKLGTTSAKSNTSGASFNASAQGRSPALANMKATQAKLKSGPTNKKTNQGIPGPEVY